MLLPAVEQLKAAWPCGDVAPAHPLRAGSSKAISRICRSSGARKFPLDAATTMPRRRRSYQLPWVRYCRGKILPEMSNFASPPGGRRVSIWI